MFELSAPAASTDPINPSLSAVFASIEAKWKRDVLPGGHHSPAVEVWTRVGL